MVPAFYGPLAACVVSQLRTSLRIPQKDNLKCVSTTHRLTSSGAGTPRKNRPQSVGEIFSLTSSFLEQPASVFWGRLLLLTQWASHCNWFRYFETRKCRRSEAIL